jgi:hypothetical protein
MGPHVISFFICYNIFNMDPVLLIRLYANYDVNGYKWDTLFKRYF